MSLTKKEKQNKTCIKCSCKLTKLNWPDHAKRDGWRVCKKCHNLQAAQNTARLKMVNPLRYKAYDLRHIYHGNVETDDLENLWLLQDGKCAICQSILSKTSNHIDHIFPISKGGKTEIENLQFLCEMCNRGKYTWSVEEYIEHCKKVVSVDG